MTAIDKVQYLQIGVQGNNNATTLEFDMTTWAEQFPSASFYILFKPYNEPEVSPQVSIYDEETKVLSWTVGSGATAVVGVGYTEIRAQDGKGLIKKSRVIPTAVENSVSGAEINPPEAYQDWVTKILNVGAAAVALSHGAEIWFSIAQNGHLVYSFTKDGETVKLDLGPIDAYAMAAAKGYTGTKEEFEQYLANIVSAVDDAEGSATAAAASAAAAEISKTYAQLFLGAPRGAASAAAMTDTDKIYVYTGTTGGGLTNGNWYFHNGTTWESGGTYNSTGLETDKTLAVSGAAADSKKTGDAIRELKTILDIDETIVYSKNLCSTPIGDGSNTSGGNSISWVENDDGTLTFNGTVATRFWLLPDMQYTDPRKFLLHAGTYTFSKSGTGADDIIAYLVVNKANGGASVDSYSGTFTISEDCVCSPQISIVAGKSLSNAVLALQVESGSSATSYEPYSDPVSTYVSERLDDIEDDVADMLVKTDGYDEMLDARERTVLPKNLNATPYSSGSGYGMTWTVNSDGSITFNGTASERAWLLPAISYNDPRRFVLDPGTYTLSDNKPAGAGIITYVVLSKLDGTSLQEQYGTFTIEEKCAAYVQVSVNSGANVTGMTISIQVEKGTDATAYTPYTPPYNEAYSKKITDLEDSVADLEEVSDFLDLHDVTEYSKNKDATKRSSGGNSSSGNSITWTLNSDGTLTFDGSVADAIWIMSSPAIANRFLLPAGTYTLSTSGDGASKVIAYMVALDASTEEYLGDYANTFTLEVDCLCYVQTKINAGQTFSEESVGFQIEAGSTKTSYVPYSETVATHSTVIDGLDERVSDLEAGKTASIPSYWETYLPGRATAITTLARSCAENADIFYFITDMHWNLNNRHSPAIIRWLNDRLNIPRLINTGDNGDYYADCADASRQLRLAMGCGEYYFADGNHEFLLNKTNGDNFYAHRMFLDKAIYGDATRAYYYVDNPAGKMRYICLANYGPYVDGHETERLSEAAQKSWFTNTALNVEDGWTVVVFMHLISTYHFSILTAGEYYISALASMQHGECACIIHGDQHRDYTMYVANGKIPIVASTCDKNKSVNPSYPDMEDEEYRPDGTVNEQAFDVVIIDKTEKKCHFVRIGYAKEGDEVRTVTYGS